MNNSKVFYTILLAGVLVGLLEWHYEESYATALQWITSFVFVWAAIFVDVLLVKTGYIVVRRFDEFNAWYLHNSKYWCSSIHMAQIFETKKDAQEWINTYENKHNYFIQIEPYTEP